MFGYIIEFGNNKCIIIKFNYINICVIPLNDKLGMFGGDSRATSEAAMSTFLLNDKKPNRSTHGAFFFSHKAPALHALHQP